MLSYAGIPLLYELDDSLALFLERFLTLEGGRLFSDSIPSQRELRHGTQGHSSHLMGLPTFNWPAEPPPRLNTLRWPSGATRWATCFAVCSDVELNLIQQAVFNNDGKTKPAQLVVADGHFGMNEAADFITDQTIDDNAWSDESGRIALSVEMWMLNPKRVTGTEFNANAFDRFWILPLVDIRYWWQFVATDSAFFSDVKILKKTTQLPGPITQQKWSIEFIGKWTRTPVTQFSYGAAELLPPSAGTISVGTVTSGSSTANAVQEVTSKATGGTFTLSFQLDASSPVETTEDIPFDASAEELADAITSLPSFQVTWKSLCKNAESSLDIFEGSADTIIEFGAGFKDGDEGDWFPDRTEFQRRHENVATVLDAVAASTGRRIVRDVLGVTSLIPAYDETTVNSKDNLESNLSTTGLEQWKIIAGGWSVATTANPGNILRNGLGTDIPEFIDVVFRDLTRNGEGGELPSGIKWEAQTGLLVVRVPMAEAVKATNGSQLTPFFSHVIKNLTHTIHTPSFTNTGIVDVETDPQGDLYSKLATRIAAKYYDWLWATFDLRFEGVKQWEPTGFDDFWEIEFGRWRLGLDMPGDRRAITTRVVSLPRNAMPAQQLIQCGTQCGWTEDFFMGELRESLAPAGHPRLDASKARAWMFLPAMELQGEEKGLLPTHKRAITVALRSVDADAEPNTFFEAHKFFCEKNVVWLDCDPYCNSENGSPSVGAACSDDPTCEVIAGECMDSGTMNLDGDSSGS